MFQHLLLLGFLYFLSHLIPLGVRLDEIILDLYQLVCVIERVLSWLLSIPRHAQ